MALDGIFLFSIIDEISPIMIDSKIEKINQPEKDEINIVFKKARKKYKLLISASSNYPRIHFTEITKKNPLSPPIFCMVLRKYLNNSKVISLEQINGDRIVKINFESTDELGFNSIYSLIIEIMGRHSNITLIRERDNIIMDSIKHLTSDINSYRNLYPGIKYIYPPKSNKLNPFDFSYDELVSFYRQNKIEFDDKIFVNIFTGISKKLSNELFYRLMNNGYTLDNISLEDLYNYSQQVFSNIHSKKFDFNIYSKKNNIVDFHCIELTILQNMTKKSYSSPSILLEDFYYKKDKADRINSKSSYLQKLVNNNIERCKKKIDILNKTLHDCKNKDKFRLYGELLTSNIYQIQKGMKEINVLNYYSENGEYINIKLAENKSPSENIQKYYKKYNKLKKSEEMSKLQLELANNELEYLESVLTNIKNCENADGLDEIRLELVNSKYLKHKKKNSKKNNLSKPLHFKSSDGNDIYVGKNNIQNDYLTLKFAGKHDIWMHTKNIPGSHVIIKNSNDISEKTLEEGANLAAYYSKAKNSTKIPVDYTEIKNVKKPNGAKPGMVIYYSNQTIYVDPKIPNIEQIK
ncbi:hypothetical protein CLTEP_00650 [Clostridium tepidiprofundi DSM 19306]|uniref:Rqc2 homolog RqcH n=1 Tax=Clostridium tepidiprofundi DSM 19306 TaxID=1121338 RepID=A0A151B7F4_9CLOT|nr:NFACT RNA binding domain-containing protein [Clostridium tepidiprofundi]KYH35672.1 hypothetical protein CLTEP_00650 [Clostridium tepidiprofundi DSM 19306]